MKNIIIEKLFLRAPRIVIICAVLIFIGFITFFIRKRNSCLDRGYDVLYTINRIPVCVVKGSIRD